MNNVEQIRGTLKKTFIQAETFMKTYQYTLPNEAKQILENYHEVLISRKINKIKLLCKYRFLKKGTLTAIGQIIHI
jgi:hypothetical protein